MSLEKPELRDHNFNEVIFMITRQNTGESFEVTGKADDGIKLARNSPKYSDLKVSGDGKLATRSTTNDRSGKITLQVDQHSPSTSQLAVLDLADPEDDRLTISIEDRAGKLLHQAFDAYLSKYAEVSQGKEQKPLEHEFTTTWLDLAKDNG